MKHAIQRHLDQHDVVNDRHFPEWDRALNASRCRGDLAAVLPGIYCYSHRADDFDVRLAAAAASTRDYVLVGKSAAKATWWPELECDVVSLAYSAPLDPKAGFEFQERFVPSQLVDRLGYLPVTVAPLTVLDLIPELGPEAVDQALRRRAVTLPGLWDALRQTPYRRGNRLRRQILHDSRGEPWSALEREAHRLLRTEGFQRWSANHEVVIDGERFFIDVALRQHRIAIELDGYEYHSSRPAFHNDRRKEALLIRAGWAVLHFSSETLHLLPGTLRAAIRRRSRRSA